MNESTRAMRDALIASKCTSPDGTFVHASTVDVLAAIQSARDADTLTDALVRVIDGWRETHPDLTYFETVTVIEGIGRTLHNLRDAASRRPQVTEEPRQ